MGVPRYWGRQQVARVSNIQSPCLSVQWVDALEAAHFHVSFDTLVFLGLPLLLALGIIILVTEFVHEEERATCSSHLKHENK